MKKNDLAKVDTNRELRGKAIVRERRQKLANSFRQSLVAHLGSDGGPVQASLIDAAVSAHIEISEISSLYIEGRASAGALRRLGAARGSLVRTLRALGIRPEVVAVDEDPDEPKGGVQEYLRRKEQEAADAATHS